MNGESETKLGCWSCSHYRSDHCEISRFIDYLDNKGNHCIGFDYEPGSDEAEREG